MRTGASVEQIVRAGVRAAHIMHPYPHTYTAEASGAPAGTVAVTATALPQIEATAPPQFDGPPGFWSPETLLCASIANCFVLTFRSIGGAARFKWVSLDCRVEGVLERVNAQVRFTRYTTHARLTVPSGANEVAARGLLERAEQACLIANSLSGARSLSIEIRVAQSAGEAA